MSATTRMWVSSIPSVGKPSLTVRPSRSRLVRRSPAPDLGGDIERHDRAVLLVVAPRLARHAPHDLELIAVGIVPVERLRDAVVGGTAQGAGLGQEPGGIGEILD